jgi:alkanesulfonate monooxygenase
VDVIISIFENHPHLEVAYWFGEGALPRLEVQGLWSHPVRSATAGRPEAQVPFVERESARVTPIP